jgi:hypothetical protein
MIMDYKKYSLEQLENWMHDAMSCGDATPQEIYDVIIGVVKDNYYIYKKQASQAYKLLALLNGNGGWAVEDVLKEKEYYEPSMPPWGHSDLEYMIHNKEPLSCDKDDPSPECKGAWNDFWEDNDSASEYNLREAEYYNKGVELDTLTKEVKAEGGYGWTPEPSDKVVKWQLPIEVDGPSGEYFVMFPDDLLEVANLKEGDTVEWVDKGDGSYILRKVNVRS